MSTAVATSLASSAYTAVRTQTASTSARCGTQAPLATNASAALTCFASSRVTRRTSTFVSTARMALSHVPPDALPQLVESLGLGWPLRKHRPVHVLRRETPGSADNDLLAVLVPLEYGAWPDTELPTYLRRYGYLPLGGHLGVRKSHVDVLPGSCNPRNRGCG